MKIALAADHRGYALKQAILDMFAFDHDDVEMIDFGCDSSDRCDYPFYAIKVAQAVRSKTVDAGILLCGTGVGMSITANRFSGVYAALCWTAELARLAKEHDNANILVIPADYVTQEEVQAMITAWQKANFLCGRYQERIDQIDKVNVNLI